MRCTEAMNTSRSRPLQQVSHLFAKRFTDPCPEDVYFRKWEVNRVGSTFVVVGFSLEVRGFQSFPLVFNLFDASVNPGFSYFVMDIFE